MGPLISTGELFTRLGKQELRMFDCTTFLHALPEGCKFRVETGRKAYNEVGHIPGAALIELQEDLSDSTSSLRFTALPPTALASAFQAKRVGDDNDVVRYAGGDPWWATRVWWLLRTIGFDRAAVLDGGLKKWRAEGRPLSTETTVYPTSGGLTLKERRGPSPARMACYRCSKAPRPWLSIACARTCTRAPLLITTAVQVTSPARSTCRLRPCSHLTAPSSRRLSFARCSPCAG